MKTFVLFSFLIVNTFSAFAQRFVADTKQSTLTWTGYGEIGSYAPSGTIQLQQGFFDMASNQITRSRMDIDMRTLHHDNEKMQEHLRGEDFFNVATFPTATFVLKQLSGQQASGQLTIKGVTKSVSFPVSIVTDKDELHIQGKATIDRTLFGIKYNSSSFFSSLGDQAIKNTFDLSFNIVARQRVK